MESLGSMFVFAILAFFILGIVLVLAPLKLYSIHRELKKQTDLLASIGSKLPGSTAPTGELQAR